MDQELGTVLPHLPAQGSLPLLPGNEEPAASVKSPTALLKPTLDPGIVPTVRH